MDPPRQPKKTNLNRDPKRNQNHSGSPHPKDAYARLLSQHNGAKFSQYLEQYAQDTSAQREGLGTSTVLRAQSDRLNIPQRRGDQVPNHFSDSSDFSPSSLKSKGDERSLSLYMEKLNSHSAQQECEKNLGAFERQQRGQRKDTTTSQDGDIESGEDAALLKLSQSKKQQKKTKDLKESSSPKKANAVGQELKMNKSKKKNLPKSSEDDDGRQGTSRPDVDAQFVQPKSPCNKNQNLQQNRGKKKVIFFKYHFSEPCILLLFLFLWLLFQRQPLFLMQKRIKAKVAEAQKNQCLNPTWHWRRFLMVSKEENSFRCCATFRAFTHQHVCPRSHTFRPTMKLY